LVLEAFARFLQLWMTEAINWTLMISDGVLLILVFKLLKKKQMSSVKDLIVMVVVKFIMLISLITSEEIKTQKEKNALKRPTQKLT